MQHGGEHEHEVCTFDLPLVGGLRRDHVHLRIRQWAVVADRTGQHIGDARLDAFGHDAAGDHALTHRFGDAAGGANAIDGAQMVAVAAAHAGTTA